MTRLQVALILVLLFLAACVSEIDPAYISEIDHWHAGRIDRLTTADGWLTLAGLHPLHEGVNTVGSVAGMSAQLVDKAPAKVGAITIGDEQILFTAHPGIQVFLAGGENQEPVIRLPLLPDTSGDPTVLAVGSLSFYIIERDGLLFLRVKDRESDVLKHFAGIDRYPVDDLWRITAQLEEGSGTTAVPNVLGQVAQAPSPGILVFKVKGKEYRLTPQGQPGQGMFIVFGDATNGQGTYPGGRFLSAEAPGEDGLVVLDFNKSTNPPCVFTPFATCPLPAVESILDVAIEAGEKMWGEPH